MQIFVFTRTDTLSNPRVLIDNQSWTLQRQELQTNEDQPADFVCVSYSWGSGRTDSPFHPDFAISDRTIPVSRAVIRARPGCTKIWVDAFCVPPPSQPIERAATLESMGFIYSRAMEVVVVLSPHAAPVLEAISPRATLLPQHLDLLEQEDWVSRAWTYQEAVNAARLSLTYESGKDYQPGNTDGVEDILPPKIVDSMEVFSYLGAALMRLSANERARYPRLNSFEDVMADSAMAGYLERSAFQVMSMMDNREQARQEDHFYAMLGAIHTLPSSLRQSGQLPLSPCEAFMRQCEHKGDYSFIMASTARSTASGRRWRPVEDPSLPAVINFPTWGEGLTGRLEEGRLVLENMLVLPFELDAGQVGGLTQESLRGWIQRWLLGVEASGYREEGYYAGWELEDAAHDALRAMGFTGCSMYLNTNNGIVFPQRPLAASAVDVQILVATGVRWTMGAMALVRYRESLGASFSYEPGVFVGAVGEANLGIAVDVSE